MKILKYIGKVITAGLISTIVISFLLCFYDLQPVHIANKKGNTDYVWSPNSEWVRLTEGISIGKFDANGYNNISVVENPDIIIGSSHMEAVEVMQNQTAAYLLGDKFRNVYSVYNMGISGHDFFKVCQYLPKDIAKFKTIVGDR
jgi:hypothetical protein